MPFIVWYLCPLGGSRCGYKITGRVLTRGKLLQPWFYAMRRVKTNFGISCMKCLLKGTWIADLHINTTSHWFHTKHQVLMGYKTRKASALLCYNNLYKDLLTSANEFLCMESIISSYKYKLFDRNVNVQTFLNSPNWGYFWIFIFKLLILETFNVRGGISNWKLLYLDQISVFFS